ncbi:MAG TPA: DUF2793 domain-containing protein [Candidatus Megaira endosymbiont of Nemacystus decipiens]|nr:DUF2793 domain-containing protein [Candidatus Megaera endosymbiont of Nemacystus decipiens]
MKTSNLALELMVPSQINKDIIYNEAILKLDDFFHNTIDGFIDTKPSEIPVGKKYIISNGEEENHICYRSSESKSVSIHIPKDGMSVYLKSEGKFIFFSENVWKDCIGSTNSKVKQFTGICKKYFLPQNQGQHSLYLSSNVEIVAKNIPLESVTLIIKQSYNQNNKLFWSSNILWNDNVIPKRVPKKNSISLIKLYSMPETDHYLGIVLGNNFNY